MSVDALFNPPQVARFREVTGLGDAPLEADFTGWNKHVVLAPDRVFLFPRHAVNVEWLERELATYRAVEPAELDVVPRVLGVWQDEAVSPYPFAAVTRLHGRRPEDAVELLPQLARLIARWHALPPPELPGARPPAHLDEPHQHWLRRALEPSTAAAAAAEAAERLHRAERATLWADVLGRAAELAPVLVHGDLHEDNLLVERGEISGIVDWETARIDHPFWDLDFGEWGTGLWRVHRHEFSRLWAVTWSAYAAERPVDPDPRPLETAFRLRQALYLLDARRDPAVVGTVEEHLAAI